MKKSVLLIAITAIWLSAFDVSLSQSYQGSIFYFSLHPGIVSPEDIVARIYVSAPFKAEVIVERNNQKIREGIITPKNGFAVIEFMASEVQSTTNYANKLREGVIEDGAIRISIPGTGSASCFVKTKYGINSGGMSVFDASKAGLSYQITSPQTSKFEENISANYASVIGLYDNTRVTFRMGGCENCFALKEDGELLRYNQTIRRTLNEGDVWILPAYGENSVLTGSTVRSNKPITVFSGSNKAYNTSQYELNYTISQELPEELFGKLYLLPQLTDKFNYPIIRAFADRPYTTVNFNGKNKFQITNPGGIRDNGYIETEVKDDSKPGINPVVISSENPISIMIIDPKINYNDKLISPFQMQILPTEQFSKTALFKIENQSEDNINIVYKDTLFDGTDFKIPDGLMISEVVNGEYNWIKLSQFSSGMGYAFSYTLSAGMSYRTKNISFSKPGTYAIKSDAPIGVYQYGIGGLTSYGFPVNLNFYDFELPDSLAPYVEYSICCKCDINGLVIDEPRLDPANRSGLGQIFMDAENSSNYKFVVEPYIFGTDSRTNWKLTRINPTQISRAHLIFYDKSGNRKDTIIECINKIPVINPNIINFGQFKVQSAPEEKILSIEIVKSKDVIIPVYLEMYVILDSDCLEYNSGDIRTYQNFDIINLRDVNILPLFKDGKLNVDIKFTSQEKGIFKDSIGITVVGYEETAKEYALYDMAFLTELNASVVENRIWAKDYSFGSVNIDSSATVELRVSNPLNGSAEFNVSLNIYKIIFSGEDIGFDGSGKAFEISGLSGISTQNPHILQPDEDLFFNVKFQPKEVKEYSAEITFQADTDKPDNKTILTGRGEPSTSVEDNLIGSKIEIRYDNGFLKFSSKEEYQIDEIEIYDLSGKLILNETINKTLNGYSLKTTNFTGGVYIVKMYINGMWFSKKVMI